MRSIFVAAVVAALATANPVFSADETPAAPQRILPAISVSAVGTRELFDRVIVTGLVAPVENIQVAPLIEGQPIDALLADVGDRVEAGQVLARLSSTTLELQKSQFNAAVATAKATVAQAEAQLIEANAAADEAKRVNDRTAALREQGTASQAAADQAAASATGAGARVAVATQSLEAARAQLALAEAQLANIDLQLARTEVKAPVAGTITHRNAMVGAIATAAGQPMFSMIRDGELELDAEVAEADLPRLAAGQKVTMTGVGTLQQLTGTVRLVEPTIDATTRLGRVNISIDQSDQVRSGMFFEAEVLIQSREGVAVPVTAVGSSPDGTTVMKVTKGKVSREVVKTGIRDGAWVEVVSGLWAGDTVVTKAGAFVRDGDEINPVPAKN